MKRRDRKKYISKAIYFFVIIIILYSVSIGYSLLNQKVSVDVTATITYEGGGSGGTVPDDWDENKVYAKTFDDGVVPIPSEFYYVTGDLSTGVVISDSSSDENNENGTNGNQFVWIPVDSSKFNITEWEDNAPTETVSPSYSEPNSQTSQLYSGEIDDYNKMKNSVKTYGGFYIGRYEASDGGGFVQEKKGATPWASIAWGDATNSIGTSGAAYYSQNMCEYYGYTSVQTTLIYGVQWDAALRVISKTHDVTDSNDWGNVNWATSNIQVTGFKEEWKAYNIYDLYGNVFEWTMEAANNGYSRTARGGNYQRKAPDYPAACRWPHASASGKDSNIGFRVSMYIN